MEPLAFLIDLFLHLDEHLSVAVTQYGAWVYLLLFVIIFCETGLVVTPFLPGDSLIFAAGALAGLGALDVRLLFVLLLVAAVVGDTVNYWLGNKLGARVFNGRLPFLTPENLVQTEQFFIRHGGKSIFLARFVPFMRTMVPFVAGVGSMHYSRFLGYNVLGALVWVSGFLFGGFFFGSIPFVQDNFSLIVIAVIALSLTPIAVEALRKMGEQRRVKQTRI